MSLIVSKPINFRVILPRTQEHDVKVVKNLVKE